MAVGEMQYTFPAEQYTCSEPTCVENDEMTAESTININILWVKNCFGERVENAEFILWSQSHNTSLSFLISVQYLCTTAVCM